MVRGTRRGAATSQHNCPVHQRTPGHATRSFRGLVRLSSRAAAYTSTAEDEYLGEKWAYTSTAEDVYLGEKRDYTSTAEDVYLGKKRAYTSTAEDVYLGEKRGAGLPGQLPHHIACFSPNE